MSAPSPPPFVVGVAPSGRGWRGALQRHVRDHETDVIVRVIRDLDGARHDELDVLVLDDDTSYLSLPLITELQRHGLGVVGIFDSDESDGHGRHHLEEAGVGVQLEGDLDPGFLLEELRRHRRDPEVLHDFEAIMARVDPPPPGSARAGRGPVIAVGGAPGVGRTELAIGLAASLSGPADRWLLADVDDVGASVARRLALPIHPNLITALEILRGVHPQIEGAPVDQGVARAVAPPGGRPFDVLAGVISRRDWSLLDPDDIELALDELGHRWPGVVLDCGPLVENLARWVDRFACTRTCLARADRIVGVLDGSPSGLVRFLDWLVDLNALDVGPVTVAVNRSPARVGSRIELEQSLRDSAGGRVADIVHLPQDPRVVRAAWDATLVGRGPFHRAVGGLAREVAAG
ncbi:MAG: hypothetical protein GY713_09620 [Actinomycetia bacterium]|nr:hypothetical protein [Actinomycetes bacterium]